MDLLIEFAPGTSTFDIVHLIEELQDLLGVPVDVFPDVDWLGLKGQRNWLSHKYDDFDFKVVWYTRSTVFPRERKLLGFG